jgi:hypothetical protein
MRKSCSLCSHPVPLQSLNNFGPREGDEFQFQSSEGFQILENLLTGPAHMSAAHFTFDRSPQTLVSCTPITKTITHRWPCSQRWGPPTPVAAGHCRPHMCCELISSIGTPEELLSHFPSSTRSPHSLCSATLHPPKHHWRQPPSLLIVVAQAVQDDPSVSSSSSTNFKPETPANDTEQGSSPRYHLPPHISSTPATICALSAPLTAPWGSLIPADPLRLLELH